MLEILIFSDSHGSSEPMCRVIESHPSATHVLFCGDGIRDVEVVKKKFPKRIFLSVCGNCDPFAFASDVPYERLVSLGGLKILLMHGHQSGVKSGYGAAAAHAHCSGADILIFGHTHIPYEGRLALGDGSVHLFNPGSIGRIYGGVRYYGLLTVAENGYLFSHGTLNA